MKASKSDILQLASMAPLRFGRISMPSYSVRILKYPHTCSSKVYIRVGRCVIGISSSNTLDLPTQAQASMLRTMSLALLSFLHFLHLNRSNLSDSQARERQLASIRLMKKNFSEASWMEILPILNQYQGSPALLFFAIPRVIVLPSSPRLIDLVSFLLEDFARFMDFSLTMCEEDVRFLFCLKDYALLNIHQMHKRQRLVIRSANETEAHPIFI